MYKLIVLINIIGLIPMLIAYASVYITPEKLWFPALFGLAYPYLLLINFLFIIFWMYHKKWVFLLSLVTILAGWNYLSETFQINFKNIEHVQGESFKMMSYNIRLLDKYNWTNDKNTSQNLLDFVDEKNADIICLQEVPGTKYVKPDKRILKKLLKRRSFYYSAAKRSNVGVLTISKYPVINRGTINFGTSVNVAIYTDLKINYDTVRVYNLHLQSIYLDPSKYKLLDTLSFNQRERNLREAGDILSHLKNAYKLRAQQTDKIARHIAKSPYPVIVSGDFNDTPISYAYHNIRGKLNDAFIESGSGISNTYIGKFPSFRIDYILHSNKLQSSDYMVEHVKYSDHYPIFCTFGLN